MLAPKRGYRRDDAGAEAPKDQGFVPAGSSPGMDPDLSRLDAFLDEEDLDGFLVRADGEDSDQR